MHEAVDLLFGTSNAFWHPETRHEAYLLIAALYRKEETMRDSLCDHILAGPPIELLPAEKLEEQRARRIFEALSFLRAASLPLSQSATARMDAIEKEHPKWRPFGHEGMSHWHSAGWVGRDRKIDAIRTASADQIIEVIASFKPDEESTLRELGEGIGVRIAQDPQWGISALEDIRINIERVPADIFNPLLWGIRAALSDKSSKLGDEECAQVLGLLKALASSRPIPLAWSSLPSVVGDLVEKLSIAVQKWEPLTQALQVLFESFDHDRGKEEKPIEWLNRAINHPYGDLTELHLKLAQREVGILTESGRPIALHASTETFLFQMAKGFGAGSQYGYCLTAQHFAWMEAVSPIYAGSMQDWFNWHSGEDRALVAWSGYLWSRTLARALVESFGSTYLETARRHALFAKEEREGLASHLAAIFWFHKEWAYRVYEVADVVDRDLRLSLLHDWRSHLGSATAEEAEAFFRNLLLPYWDWCSRQEFFAAAESDGERFAFYRLLPYSFKCFPEAARRAIESRPRQSKVIYMLLREVIAQHMFTYPDELVDLLLVLVELEPHPHLEREEWKEIWKQLEPRAPKNLETLENELARRSITVR